MDLLGKERKDICRHFMLGPTEAADSAPGGVAAVHPKALPLTLNSRLLGEGGPKLTVS